MLYDEKVKRLKALPLLKQIPDRQIASLAEFVRPREMADGEVLFQEGSRGMSLYFVSGGRIRISKAIAEDARQDLAILGPGEFFGEMALVDEATRSASATALGPCVLFELFRGDLGRWAKSNPQQAVQFFAELVLIQSRRLRRTSDELTLHFDLSSRLFDQSKPQAEFMAQVLDRVVAHLPGSWSAAARLANAAGGMDSVAARGGHAFEEAAAPVEDRGEPVAWTGDSTLRVLLAGRQGTVGALLFHCEHPVGKEDREDLGRMLTTVARVVSSALEIRKLSAR